LAILENSVLDWSNYYFVNYDMESPINKILFDKVGEKMTTLKLAYREASKKKLLTTHQFADILRNKAPFLEVLEIEHLPESIKKSPLFSLSASIPRPELELRKIVFQVSPLEEPYSEPFLGSLFKCAQNMETLLIDYMCPELMLIHGGSSDVLEGILTSFMNNGKLDNLKKLILRKLHVHLGL